MTAPFQSQATPAQSAFVILFELSKVTQLVKANLCYKTQNENCSCSFVKLLLHMTQISSQVGILMGLTGHAC